MGGAGVGTASYGYITGMAGAVFFLLLGMLFSEFALVGLDWAGMIGAALLTMSATVLVHHAFARYEASKQATATPAAATASKREPASAGRRRAVTA